jgi:phosphoribosylglycinamide formyltransferase-1
MNIAVFASGQGTNFQVLAERFPSEIRFVFSDHRNAFVLKRAEKLNVKAYAFELKEFANKAAYEAAMIELLDAEKIDLIILAGYMKIVGDTFLSKYKGKIINVHPSFLPNFAGSPHAIEESWAAKRGLGVTVHFVDEGVDTGEIIAQQKLPYLPDLADYEKSVHALEYVLYPAVVSQLIENKKEI